MKLVDTLAEQELLERLLERSKPPLPPDCASLHYLLATPFRYAAPYPAGSRFRAAGHTPGVFYASHTVVTAVAETAFARLRFFAESPTTPWPVNPSEHTAFSVRFRTAAGLDLTVDPLARDAEHWTHPTDYAACHALADAARAAGIAVMRYTSARDPTGGKNIALLACAAFRSRDPLERQTWRLQIDRTGVRALCEHPEQRLAFDRRAFARDPRIAALNWNR